MAGGNAKWADTWLVRELPAAIEDGQTGTLCFRFRTTTITSIDAVCGLSDLPKEQLKESKYNGIRATFFIDPNETGRLKTKSGADWQTLENSDRIDDGIWHRIWLVADNANDVFETHIQGGEWNEPTLLRADSGEPSLFRNGPCAESLKTLCVTKNIGPGEGGAYWTEPVHFDDFFIDPTGKNLSIP